MTREPFAAPFCLFSRSRHPEEPPEAVKPGFYFLSMQFSFPVPIHLSPASVIPQDEAHKKTGGKNGTTPSLDAKRSLAALRDDDLKGRNQSGAA